MNKFKGTQGNWSTFEGMGIEDENGFSVAIADNISIDNRYELKGAKHWSEKGFSKDLTEEEVQANALLISKAPELLEMVKLLVDRLEENDLGKFNAVIRAKELIKQATERE